MANLAFFSKQNGCSYQKKNCFMIMLSAHILFWRLSLGCELDDIDQVFKMCSKDSIDLQERKTETLCRMV